MTLGEKPRPSNDGTLPEGAFVCWGAFFSVWDGEEEAVLAALLEGVAGAGLLACENEKVVTA